MTGNTEEEKKLIEEINLLDPSDREMVRETAYRLVSVMTLEEKASLCSGEDLWHLKSMERLGLRSIMMTDGPHGLRKLTGERDNLGIGESVPAVCYPTASALACSFDRELAKEVGTALGEECRKEGISVLLGPGANQKRSPLCGRNFEYFSEDPFLTGEMAAAMIQGVQSRGIGTSLKHFAVNNQEKRRMTISAMVDERTLRETYLKGFEIAVRKGQPWTVMCAYNKLNGTYCSENPYLLSDILRDEWGFDGLIVSDWGAVSDRVAGVKAGLDLEMPGSYGYNDAKIIDAVKNHDLSVEELDRSVFRITEMMLKAHNYKQDSYFCDMEAHHELAVKAAAESAVLLKNEDHILPGNVDQKAVVIGALAKEPRYQGAGSSKINPYRLDNAWSSLIGLGLNAEYAGGYSIKENEIMESAGDNLSENRVSGYVSSEEVLQEEALRICKGKDIVYLFAGLPEGFESEGFDRIDMSLPGNQNRLIEAVCEVNPNVVVILSGGAPIELPWMDKVKGILLSYLGGEGAGTAAAKLLLGKAVPCGKLAETWPMKLSDTPAYHYYPGGYTTVEYRESIFIGYRYYEAAKKKVRFPFGHGLSYSDFTYSDMKIGKEEYQPGDIVTVSFNVTNNGTVTAKETALVFVGHSSDKVFLPEKELRGFDKVIFEPGEKKRVSFNLDTSSFAYYDVNRKGWYAESGEYTIYTGPSAGNSSLQISIHLVNAAGCINNGVRDGDLQPDGPHRYPTYHHLSEGEFKVSDEEYKSLYGKDLPDGKLPPKRPYHNGSTVTDIRHTLVGKSMARNITRMAKELADGSKEDEGMMVSMLLEMPFHSMIASGQGMMTERMLGGILDMANRHYLKGAIKLLIKK